MKTLAIATSLFALGACSDEADIGIDSSPITCQQTAAADMSGSVDYNGQTYTFSNAAPTVTRDPAGTITTLAMWSSEDPGTQRGNYLRFDFGCGQAEVASYNVKPGTDQQLACPHEVSGSILGSIEVLPAQEGVLIVDEMSSCIAGRFRVDVDGGAVGGWFSVPLL